MRTPKKVVPAMIAGLLAIAACTPMQTPLNLETVADAKAYQAQYRMTEDDEREARNRRSLELNAKRCRTPPKNSGAGGRVPGEVLSRGDLVTIRVGDDDIFSGNYEISRDGTLKMPHLKSLSATGRSFAEMEDRLRDALVSGGLYRRAPRVSVRIADFAPARVHVRGAVFTPGATEIGRVAGEDRDRSRQAALGASTEARNLSAALRAAGGVRPDADLARVMLHRNGEVLVYDLSPAIEGRAYDDVMLVTGDEIEIPSRNCFQEALMVPNAITAPGVKVFMSNLTKPADANALSAVGKDTRELRYGTRFLQAVVGMNCVGGTQATNADRWAVLFSRNPITGESIVIERRIEDVLRRADRDDLDPFILPGDALACYDSTVTNIVDVARAVSVVLTPSALIAL